MKKSQNVIQHIADKIKTPDNSKKKEYRQPRILNYGKLKDIALGGSVGNADSGGAGFVTQPPGFPLFPGLPDK